MNARDAFARALLVERVARRTRRVAMEHSSPEALNKYLQEHPDADKAKHTVKKDDKGKANPDKAKPGAGGHPSISKGKGSSSRVTGKGGRKVDIRTDMIPDVEKYLKKNPDADPADAADKVKAKYQKERQDSDAAAAKARDKDKSPSDEPAKSPAKPKSDSGEDRPRPKMTKFKDEDFMDGGKFDTTRKDAPSSAEYIDAVPDALASKKMVGMVDAQEHKKVVTKFKKLPQREQEEFAWRLIEEGDTLEDLEHDFFKSKKKRSDDDD